MPQWELLVTQGHIRAARWRNAVPFLFWGALAAIILGVVLAWSLPDSLPSTRVAEAKSAYADAQRRAVSAFLQERGATFSQSPPQLAAPAPAPVAVVRCESLIFAHPARDSATRLADSAMTMDFCGFMKGS